MLAEDRISIGGQVVRALAGAYQAAGLYPLGHPERRSHARRVVGAAAGLVAGATDQQGTLFVVRGGFYLGVVLLPRESLALGRFADALEAAAIESITLTAQVTEEDVDSLVEVIRGRLPLRADFGGLRVNALRPAVAGQQPWQEILGAYRRAYAGGVTALQRAADRASRGEPIDIGETQMVVEQLHRLVEQDAGYGLLLSAVKSYDEYTYFHMVNVALLSVALGQAIGLRRDQVLVLGLGGLLHDIGKVFVPEEVLNGTGQLDEEQWRLVQRHPVDGAALLLTTDLGLVHPASAVLLEHHAAYDLSGYPTLHEHGPSVPSRLVAVADCFDAVTSKRSYRQPLSRHEALQLLTSAAGTGLDPQAVAAFKGLLGRFPIGSLVELSSGEMAVVVRQHPHVSERPVVLVLLDATGTPVEVEERDLGAEAPFGPRVVRQRDAEQVGLDLPRFVASGQVHSLPGVDHLAPDAGGLVHEPAPGEVQPDGFVDSHNGPGEQQHHDHRHASGQGDRRIDPDVAPPFDPLP